MYDSGTGAGCGCETVAEALGDLLRPLPRPLARPLLPRPLGRPLGRPRPLPRPLLAVDAALRGRPLFFGIEATPGKTGLDFLYTQWVSMFDGWKRQLSGLSSSAVTHAVLVYR